MALQVRHLRLLVLLRDTSSLSQAAHQLGVTQPTTSRMLNEVERHIGAVVLARAPRGSQLTPLGEEFVDHAAQTLGSFDALTDPSRWHQQKLTIAYAWGGLESVLTTAVGRWHQSPSNTICELRQHDDPLHAVESGIADLAIIRGGLDSSLLSSSTLYRENRVVVLPVDSALADLPRIKVTDLQDLEIVLNIDSGTTTSVWGDRLGVRKQMHVHGVDEWVITIAAHPRRYGITPESTMSYYNHPRVVVRSAGDLPDIPVRLAWRSAERSSIIQRFISYVKDAA